MRVESISTRKYLRFGKYKEHNITKTYAEAPLQSSYTTVNWPSNNWKWIASWACTQEKCWNQLNEIGICLQNIIKQLRSVGLLLVLCDAVRNSSKLRKNRRCNSLQWFRCFDQIRFRMAYWNKHPDACWKTTLIQIRPLCGHNINWIFIQDLQWDNLWDWLAFSHI